MFVIALMQIINKWCTAISLLFLPFFCYVLIASKKDNKNYSLTDCLEDTAKSFAPKSSKHLAVFFSFCLFLAISCNTAFQSIIGIHDLRLEDDGEYCYYIELEYDGVDDYFCEITPALIQVRNSDETDREKRGNNYYYIMQAVSPRNQQLHIEFDKIEIEIGDRIGLKDKNGETYICTLLNEHAYSPFFKEHNDNFTFNLVMLCIEITSFSILILSMAKSKREDYKNDC